MFVFNEDESAGGISNHINFFFKLANCLWSAGVGLCFFFLGQWVGSRSDAGILKFM